MGVPDGEAVRPGAEAAGARRQVLLRQLLPHQGESERAGNKTGVATQGNAAHARPRSTGMLLEERAGLLRQRVDHRADGVAGPAGRPGEDMVRAGGNRRPPRQPRPRNMSAVTARGGGPAGAAATAMIGCPREGNSVKLFQFFICHVDAFERLIFLSSSTTSWNDAAFLQ